MKVLVTGASSGIGKATAILLARKGHEVLMVSRRKERLEEIATTSATVVGSLMVDALDVSNPENVAAFCTRQAAWLQDIDLLVNNAGLALGTDTLDESREDDVLRVIETNVTGLLALTRRILPFMKARKRGHIINLGSVAATNAYKGGTVYCASKAAVHMITDCLRLDLGGTGIRVSTIAPGRVAETEFSEVRFGGDIEKAKKVYEGYRVMTSSDVASAIAWIAEQPEHINIQELVILPTDQAAATTLDPLK
ncbi:MAG: SDR family NAD(P)-dependent oxidoreductase [Bdellovibrionota bacterium]